MRLRRRQAQREQLPQFDGEFQSGGVVLPRSGTSGSSLYTCDWEIEWPKPRSLSELELAHLVARHASELVDRLLSERAGLRACLHDYFPRVAIARVRLQQWQEGDGSKPREVLADLEDILG